jgi:DNA-directed RNA polymerase specialized sigma24 family protein
MKSIWCPVPEVQAPALPPGAGQLLAENRGLFFYLARRWYEYVTPFDRCGFGVDDLAAEFMLAAVRRLHKWRPERRSFAHWLGLEARSCAWKVRRRALRKKRAAACVSQFAGDDEFDRFSVTVDLRQREPWEIASEREESL